MNFHASYHQERLWLIDKSETTDSYRSGPLSFNVPLIIEINGAVEAGVLEKSILQVIQRHEILRTRFNLTDNQLFQVILSNVSFKLEIEDWTNHEKYKDVPEILLETAVEVSRKPFNLDKEPMIRGRLFLLLGKKSLLVITLHHSIVDRISLGIISREIFSYYTANVKGLTPTLPPLDLQYADFSQWQRELPEDILESQLLYWRGKWKGESRILELPSDQPRASAYRFKDARHSFSISKAVCDKIKSQIQGENISYRGILMAAFNLLLGRYSGRDEIVVGTNISYRGDEQLHGVVGPIDDFILTRTCLSAGASFVKLAVDLQDTLEQDMSHCLIPMVKLAAELNPDENMNNTILFNVLFQYEDEPLIQDTYGNLEVRMLETNLGWGNYDLNLLIQTNTDPFSCVLVYNCVNNNNYFISRLIQHYKNLLDSISRDPDSDIFRLSYLTEDEYRVLTHWNGTDAHYPRGKSLHQLFEEQVEKTPENVAVIFPGTGENNVTLTYEELNNNANRLADHLRNHCGVRPNDLVGVLLEPSEKMIVALLGILKAGGAYVPIDPIYPPDRVNYILDDSKCGVLITGGNLKSMATSRPNSVMVDIAALEYTTGNAASNNLENANEQENTAYVIYTSGTTGKPKGCMISHKNVVRLFKTDKLPFSFDEGDTWIMAHSFCFDFSVWEMYGALLFGGQLVVPTRETVQDVRSFCTAVKQYRVSVLNQTPGAFYNFIEEEKKSGERKLAEHLRYVCFGGEKLEPAYLEEWSRLYPADTIRLVNMYGITETTVHVTYYYLKGSDIQSPNIYSPIGIPLPETKVYVFDQHMQLVTPGVIGEFYVGGSGVSKGYLYRDQLTAERFIENPHKKGEILYRTGDLGRWTEEGKLQYVGRMDDQVKIRGYRIELAEIENTLLGMGKIKRAAVTLRRDKDGDNYLIAYFTASEKLDINGLRFGLNTFLPAYMIPKYFVQIEGFPLTSSGKIDKMALPEPNLNAIPTNPYTPPATELEKILAKTWGEVLGVDRIGTHDNFFDLGGNSIKGIRVINKIQKLLGEIIHIAVLFQAPTIAELAAKLESYREDDISVSRVELEHVARLKQIILPLPPLAVKGARNKPAVFILSPPRSGSTLLRVILAGHPRLFAPPELELLSFNTLRERKQGLARSLLAEGTIRAIKEIKKCDSDEAVSIMEKFEAEDLTSFQLYKILQEWLGDRILVDKSPFYSLDLEILKRAELYFESAKYIHLQRHPGASIHSFVKAKIDQVFRYENPFSVRELAEAVWVLSHQNIFQFLNDRPRDRQYSLRYEDLINHPEPVTRELCEFIGIPYDEQMLQVYNNLEKKMTDGLYGESRMVGDVKFLTHTSIDRDTADNWKADFQENSLGGPARRLAVSMAYWEENVGKGDFVPIPVPEADHYELSPSQRRIWLANQMEKSSVAYNMPFAYRLDGELSREIIERSFKTLVKRHESLRTVFISVDGTPRQKICSFESFDFNMEYIDLRSQQDREEKSDRIAMDEAKTPFDLEAGPLIRVKLIQLEEKKNLLLLNLHHIIVDAWSMETIISEIFCLYDAYKKNKEDPLPPLKFQFKNYSAWQNQWMNSPHFKEQEKFWLQLFEGEFPVLDLPTDFPRTATATFEGDTVNILIDEKETVALNLLAKQENVTLYMIFLSLFNVLLSKITGQEDIVIGSGIEGHKNEEFDRVVGMFFNFLLLRCFPGREKTFIEFLSEVKSMVLGAFQNQDYPLELLLNKIKKREAGRNPLAEVTFAYHNIGLPTHGIDELSISPYLKNTETSKFELSLFGSEMNGQISLQIDFRKNLFRRETIERMGLYFKEIMKDLLDNQHKKLKDVKIDYDFAVKKLNIFERQKSDFVF